MANSDVATSKGTILRSLLAFVQGEVTKEQFDRLLQDLPADDASILRGEFLASDRVPESTLNRLTEAAAKMKGEDLESFGRRAGRAELEDGVKIYRFLLAVMTPQALLGRASALWSTVHNRGTMNILEKSDHHARVQLADFPSERAHCARLAGWFIGLADMTRVQDVELSHDKCRARGEGDCEWTLRWK